MIPETPTEEYYWDIELDGWDWWEREDCEDE